MRQYSVRAQFGTSRVPKPLRKQILERDGYTCGYCGFDATTVDHIIPYSYGGTDDPGNLIACCSICNTILGNRVFPHATAKRKFIQSRYGPYLEGRIKRHRRNLSICADCGMIYCPSARDATNVLCVQCNLDDQAWPPHDARRILKQLERDRYTAQEKKLLALAGRLMVSDE